MTKFKLFLALTFVSVAFISCDPSDTNGSSQNDDTFAQNFGNSVSKDFIGQVVDIDNHPIQNAEIKIGSSTVQTDVNGVFIINGAAVHEKFAYITATKAGYIDGSRAMVPTSGKNNVRIMLIANTPLQTIQSGVDSEVALPSGTKVAFDGEFQDENGNAYSGTVSVSMFHLLPSDENIDKLMPGMLYAQTKTNEEAVLETFGMLNVELRGSAGQKLNIELGHKAEITMKIDDSQTATAPNTIPLWYFDEYRGYWKEDGVARKIGNNYVGEVSHFSWWNCDVFSSVVSLTITIVDINGNPLSNVGVGLVVNATNFNSYTSFTDNQGQITGMIPANQTLTLNVFDICGNPSFTTQIGPFTANTVLPTITYESSSTQAVKIEGSFVKCDGTLVTNGYVMLFNGSHLLISELDSGNYSFSTLACSSSNVFEVEGCDIENYQSTGRIAYNFNFPVTNINQLQSCDAVSEFVICKIDNIGPRLFTSTFNTQLITNGTNVGFDIIHSAGELFAISWSNPTFTSGTYTNNNFQMQTAYEGLGFMAYVGFTNSVMVYRVNKFGQAGDYIDITFDGTFDNFSGTHTISGMVHVIRDN
ncbi:Ig-like domain-containing protein [Flavobacterium sp. AS60]|uniref:Ig-like domain-containing protein n=1 Tax=Flavobacterium anseongense TaxID=2910677 RepID=UPI001F2280BA|nr:Ig-like domain-containing protein [Flavobacterium sp. AS60]MCF6130167.1 Ig-like domain-containing protein [Flavobacterium sp. AS60]